MQLVPVTEKNKSVFSGLLLYPVSKPEGKRMLYGIVVDGTPAGGVVLDDEGYNVVLESIYILPEYRRRGLATDVIDKIMEQSAGEDRLFLMTQFRHSREDLESLFLSCGFVLTEAGIIYSFYQNRVINSEKTKKLLYRDMKGICKEVGSLSKFETNELRSYVEKSGFSADIINSTGFKKDYSSCVFYPEDRLQAYMLCSEYGNDIVVDLVGGRGESNTAIMLTLRHLFEKLYEKNKVHPISDDCHVLFQALKPSVVSISQKLFNGSLNSDDFSVLAVREF